MQNTSYIEISKKAYKNNIRFIRKIVGNNVKISIVVKGNAYGHGIEQIIPIAEENKINHFSVYSAFEAEQVQKVKSEKSSVMIFGYISDEQLEWVINNKIEFYVFDLNRLKSALKIAEKNKIKAKIHLELETGFKRTGLEEDEFLKVIKLLKKYRDFFSLEGLCTHFAGAESISNYVRIKNQLSLFRKYCRYFKRNNLIPKSKHTASSAATLLYPETVFDLVRIGIIQYGYWPTTETLIFRHNKFGNKESSLKRVISWKSEIMAIKLIKRGDFIGYGTNYQANKNMKIAIIPVGYNNGYSRSLSNKGRVIIQGRRLDVVGTVTMNTISVNITDLKNVNIGDEVVLIGKQKKTSISVASFGELSNNLNYQVLSRLPQNIPRYIVE